MPRFGGALSDVNGLPPLTTITLGGKPVGLDTNLTVFSAQVALLIVGVLLIR